MKFVTLLLCLFILPAFANPTAEVLSRDAVSNNTSELFAKVLTLEESMRDITGKMQNLEHDNQTLSKKLNDLLNKGEALPKQDSATSSQNSDEKLLKAIQMIENKNFDQAIAQLNELSAQHNKKFSTPGEISYWQGQAYLGKNDYSTASGYLAKSYRYYSDTKPNDVLFKLIETLVLGKKYTEACGLLNKLSDKYIKTLSAERKKYISNLETSQCK